MRDIDIDSADEAHSSSRYRLYPVIEPGREPSGIMYSS